VLSRFDLLLSGRVQARYIASYVNKAGSLVTPGTDSPWPLNESCRHEVWPFSANGELRRTRDAQPDLGHAFAYCKCVGHRPLEIDQARIESVQTLK